MMKECDIIVKVRQLPIRSFPWYTGKNDSIYGNTRRTIFERSDRFRRTADAGKADGGVFWPFERGKIERHQRAGSAQGDGSIEFEAGPDDRGELFSRR